MRKALQSMALRLASVATLAAWATAAPASAADVSVGYSGLAASDGMVHGAQVSLGSGRPGLGFTGDAAYYRADDGYVLLAAGPRWSSRGGNGSGRFFVQLVAGYLVGGDGGAFAAPGAGVEFGADRKLGGRLQVDGPFLVGGGIAGVVRVSGGIVWRPGQRHPAAVR